VEGGLGRADVGGARKEDASRRAAVGVGLGCRRETKTSEGKKKVRMLPVDFDPTVENKRMAD
jgi:hypothetical protein